MKHILPIFFLLQTYSISANIGDNIERQIIVQVSPENSTRAYLEKLFPNTRIELSAESFQLWNVEFPITPDMEHLAILKRDGKIRQYTRNRRLYTRSTTPNDALFNQQIFHSNDFNIGQSVPFGINSIGAWDFNKSGVTAQGDTIVVAVCEDGFDSLHQDLDYFINYSENPNDTIDNDGNGAKNDFRGWNVAYNNSSLQGGGISHAMRVCGAFARGNNTIGISGITWNCKILPINFNGAVSVDNSIKAYEYCLKMKRLYRQSNKQKGAYIVAINFSFGTTGDPAEDTLWKAAIDSLGKEGILMSVSVDNRNSDVESYQDLPVLLNSPFQINVTNYNYNTLETDGSAYSKKYVHLAAPNKYHTTLPNNAYGNSGFGASFSAPLVASTVALMYSNFESKLLDSLKANPIIVTQKVKESILKSVDITTGLTNKVVSNGKLNLYKTIVYARSLHDSLYKKKDSIPNALNSNSTSEVQIYQSEKYIYTKKLIPLPLSITLYNMLGQTVMNFTVKDLEERIDIHHLPSGFYFLCYSLNQNKFTEKVVLK